MNTTVTTARPVTVDGCADPVTEVRFPNANMLIDKIHGDLHIHTTEGTIASFNHDEWVCATRGEFYLANDGAAVRKDAAVQG